MLRWLAAQRFHLEGGDLRLQYPGAVRGCPVSMPWKQQQDGASPWASEALRFRRHLRAITGPGRQVGSE